MEAIFSKRLISTSLLIILASNFITPNTAERAHQQQQQQAFAVFIRSSCSSTTYPRLCYTSLVKHADSIQRDRVLLTDTALNVTLASTKATSAAMSVLARNRGMTAREVGAIKDCVEELRDSVDELRRSIGEMVGLRTSNFEMTMSDVQTWVSAALTDESTCTDGFQLTSARDTGDIKSAVRGRIVEVAQLTSNALALINQLATSQHA